MIGNVIFSDALPVQRENVYRYLAYMGSPIVMHIQVIDSYSKTIC